MLEAILFAAAAPLSAAELAAKMPEGVKIDALLHELQTAYASRGVNLKQAGEAWAFRTAPDLGFLLEEHRQEEKKLSRPALETLAIIAYHQPVTRAEIEEVRGVSTSKGTLDVLLETGWVRPKGRRRTPGRPLTFGTTTEFLDHFGLSAISDLPGLAELKAAGLLNATIPPGFDAQPPFGEPPTEDFLDEDG
ncbi:SMC-Scp complex subunit ScpB [Afifella sp. IM 167]|nr:SMC-Scp complex subunit ScpB [Afifella sp. IM 167]MBZ8132559.1 SMC-Scp complex subunit ScpB [Afifella sp. IM 167]